MAIVNKSKPNKDPLSPCYVRSVELRNIRGFSHLTVDLRPENASDGMLTAVIGKNGTCKSTLLRCLSMALVSRGHSASALLETAPGNLVRNVQEAAFIIVEFCDAKGAALGSTHLEIRQRKGFEEVTEFNRSGEIEDLGENFACAYGPARGFSGTGSPERRSYQVADSIRGLFDYDMGLQDPELIFRRLRDEMGSKIYDRALAGLRRILGLRRSQNIELPPGGGVFITGGKNAPDIPLEGWADGYRLTTTWLLDFYGWAIHAGALDEKGDARGVLLIDEVEQHLHPTMQANLLVDIKRAFPKVQVIVSTHSPLVAMGAAAKSGNVLSLHRSRESVRGVMKQVLPHSVEDVLTSDLLFDANIQPEPMQKQIDEYHQLLRKGKGSRSRNEREKMKVLAQKLDESTLPEMNGGDLDERRKEMRALLEAAMAEKGGAATSD